MKSDEIENAMADAKSHGRLPCSKVRLEGDDNKTLNNLIAKVSALSPSDLVRYGRTGRLPKNTRKGAKPGVESVSK